MHSNPIFFIYLTWISIALNVFGYRSQNFEHPKHVETSQRMQNEDSIISVQPRLQVKHTTGPNSTIPTFLAIAPLAPMDVGEPRRDLKAKPSITSPPDRKPVPDSKPTKKRKQMRNHDPSMRFIKIEVGETIHLRCRIPIGPYLVVWNKIGMDHPLTVDTRRFTPDKRVQVRFRQPDKWRLSIAKARPTDSGVYTCTTSLGDKTNQATSASDDDSTGQSGIPGSQNTETDKPDREKNDRPAKRKSNSDYYVTVVEPDPLDRFQVDAPATEKHRRRNKTITVTGPKIVFYGTSLELVCRASFPNAEAKSNSRIHLEWYHRGIRRRPDPKRSGGVYIRERWLDSDLLESRLLIAWASAADAGQWICLDRSNLQESQPPMLGQQSYSNAMLGSTGMSKTDRIGRLENTGGANRIHLSPVNTASNGLKPRVRYNSEDLAFDRIEVEIVDLPDPTESLQTTTPQNPGGRIPAFAVMNDDPRTIRRPGYQIHGSKHPNGKLSSAWVMRPTSGRNAARHRTDSVHFHVTPVLIAITLIGYIL